MTYSHILRLTSTVISSRSSESAFPDKNVHVVTLKVIIFLAVRKYCDFSVFLVKSHRLSHRDVILRSIAG